MISVEIDTEYIKLDSFLKYCDAVSTGGEAKMVILDGLVLVNGEIELRRGKKLRSNDIVKYDNKEYQIIVCI